MKKTCCEVHPNYTKGCEQCKKTMRGYITKNRSKIRKQQNARWGRLKDSINARRRQHHAENPEHNRTQMRNWRTKNPERYRELLRLSYYRHHESRKERMRNHNRKLKLEVLSHYANGFLGCVCCKTEYGEFLTLDHIENDGHIHRRKLFGVNMGMAGQALYMKLKQLGYPETPRLQILCFNCQTMKWAKEPCIH